MNNDAEAIKQMLLAWLLQEPPANSEPSGERSSHSASSEESGINRLQSQFVDSLDSDAVGDRSADRIESNNSTFSSIPSLEFGDIPAVQDRFQALLKRKLRAEIERNPPRFPWESETFDYDSEYADITTPDLIPVHLWTTQLQSLRLPVPMPHEVLVQLFDQCRVAVQSSLREGAKLVQAVEDLFPGQQQSLNQVANWVMSAPARSGPSALQAQADPQSLGFPNHYEAATPAQQMALSLLAARELLKAMTMQLSPSQPSTERNWLTDLGTVLLKAEYEPEMNRVRVQGTLPHQGSLCFRSRSAQSIARCSSPGDVSVELLDLEPNQSYFLEVQFEGSDQPPLVFAIHPTTEG